ncbi:recombination regulator RecX [Aerococcus agrisoli]|uniref:Regulatory protein RecX n=1 Tax=Aerococcus agrisoli TaxID=2487350 RepID=A0A3N4GX96_9LACT|nr:recombination regulator RecX [Aerococcus agrisoli]RPA57604.1 recombination regulator RecX [Aerococcus agrisoli]
MPEKKRGPMKLSEIGTSKPSPAKPRATQDRPTPAAPEKNYQTRPKPRPKQVIQAEDSPNPAQDLLAKAQQLRAQKPTNDLDFEAPDTLDQERQAEVDANIQSGTITLIEVQKKNKKRFNIYLNGQFAFGISENTLVKFALHKGQELDTDFVKDLKEVDKADYAYQLAVRFLSHQLRSEKEVRDKLKDEDIEPAVIETAIEKLQAVELIDDTVYGQSYTRTAMNINKKGPKMIERELKNKGLNDEEISQSIAEYDQDVMHENALDIAEKYFQKQLRKASHRNAIQKTKQYLVQKGYDSDLIQELMRQLSEDNEDEDQEMAVLLKDLEKYMRRYQKLKDKDRTFKVKGMLYNKGYSSELINQAIETFEENDY